MKNKNFLLDIIDSRNLIRKVNKILKTVESSIHTEVVNIIAYSLAYGKVLFITQFNIGLCVEVTTNYKL